MNYCVMHLDMADLIIWFPFQWIPKATVNIVNIVQKSHSHSCQKIEAHISISIQLGIDFYKHILTQDKILVKTIYSLSGENTVLHFLVCKVGILIYCYLGIKNSAISMWIQRKNSHFYCMRNEWDTGQIWWSARRALPPAIRICHSSCNLISCYPN